MNSLRPACLLFARTTRVRQPFQRLDPLRHIPRARGHDPWQHNTLSSQLRLFSQLAPRREENKSSPARSEPARTSLLSRLPFFRSGSADDPNSSAASFKKIVSLAKPEKKPLLAAVGLLLISSTVSLSIPFTVGRLIDYFSTPNPSIPYGLSIYEASAILFVIFTVGGAANAGRAFLMKMSGQRIVARLRERTYAATLRQEVEYVERGEGDALSRLNVDSSIVGESVTQNLSDGLRATVQSFAGFGAMFYVSPHLTLLVLALVPPISFGAVFYGRYLKKLSHRTQEAVGEMSKVASEALSALRTVQVSNAAPYEEQKFSERVKRVLELARKEAIASGIFFGSTGWSGNVALLALLGYGGSLVSQGMITVGDLTSLLMYSVYVGSGLQMLTGFFSSIMRGIGAGQRIFELLDRRPAIPPGVGVVLPHWRTGVLRFENVGFSYPSRLSIEVLRDFQLDVTVGESVAIVGKSGSGKSSVNALLLRYYDPIKGKITYDGQDIREFTPESWRNAIGVVPQDPVLFTGTVATNIAYGMPDAPREDIEAAARAANCEFILGLPHGFDTPIGRLSLSGGQRQRLAIARALLRKPKILCLDEATSALDAASERRVNDAIDHVMSDGKTTCLIVAHRLSTIARAERVVVLEDGVVSEMGTYAELVKRPNSRFRELMAEQLAAADATDLGLSSARSAARVVDEPDVAVEREEEVDAEKEGESEPEYDVVGRDEAERKERS
ncbi:unnamed protein product [Peniophora sp. CBMAI 1063]|nr:unnamed protein product [Peniophora sp. CBMAI 1063]